MVVSSIGDDALSTAEKTNLMSRACTLASVLLRHAGLPPLLLPELQMLVLMVGKMRVRNREQRTCCCCGWLAAPAQHAQHIEHPDPSQCLRQVWELQDKALSAEPDAQGLVGGLEGVAAQMTTPFVLSAFARFFAGHVDPSEAFQERVPGKPHIRELRPLLPSMCC